MKQERVIAILTVVVVVVVFFASFIASSPGTTSTSTGLPTFSLVIPSTTQTAGGTRSAFEDHLLAIESRNASAVLSEYASNSTLTLEGNGAFEGSGLAGTYAGSQMIVDFYSTFLSDVAVNFSAPSFLVSSQSVVNATFSFVGDSSVIGSISGVASDQVTYALAASGLLIETETLNFVSFSAPNLQSTG